MSFVTDLLFGSAPEQTGTAISPGQQYAQDQFRPLLQQQAQAAMGGQPLWQTGQAPGAPQAATYNAPQMPFSSPTDYLQQGEMDTARNIMEQFGGGSARGGQSGSGYDMQAGLSSKLAQGAMGRYMQASLPFAQMQNQASMFGAQGQNQMSALGFGGQMQQYGYENQAMQAPWNYQSLYSNTTGSPIVDPGQQGILGDLGTFGGMLGLDSLFGGGGGGGGGLYANQPGYNYGGSYQYGR